MTIPGGVGRDETQGGSMYAIEERLGNRMVRVEAPTLDEALRLWHRSGEPEQSPPVVLSMDPPDTPQVVGE